MFSRRDVRTFMATRRSRGRGVTLWPVSPSLVRPRPLARALGASKKEQKRAGRQGPPRYLAVAVLEGKASVCTTCFFGLWLPFAVCRFVPAPRCSNPAWCKPSGPCIPARPLPGFQAGPLAFFGPVVGEVSALFEAQPGAQGDAGLRFGLFSPSLVHPRPLARALGIIMIKPAHLWEAI